MPVKFNPLSGQFDLVNAAPVLTGFVPYTGATADVDLGINNIKGTDAGSPSWELNSSAGSASFLFGSVQIKNSGGLFSVEAESFQGPAGSQPYFPLGIQWLDAALNADGSMSIGVGSPFTVSTGGQVYTNTGLVDSTSVLSIDSNTRRLLDESGTQVAGWGAGETYGFHVYGGLQVDNIFSSGAYVDFGSGGDTSILTRALVDSTNIDSIDPKNRYLVDPTGVLSANYGTRYLYDTDGLTIVAQWGDFSGFLYLPTGLAANSILDLNGVTSVNTGSRLLCDATGNPTLDYANRIAYDGSSINSFDWENRICRDSSNATSIHYNNRYLASTAGTSVLDYQNTTGIRIANKLYIGGAVTPTAKLHLAAGAAAATTAPLKFTSGTNMTTAEAGSMEYNGTNLFFTRAGTVRENVLVAVDAAVAPTTSVGVAITNFYGSSATNFLGTPNRWISVNIAGTVYKIPMYS